MSSEEKEIDLIELAQEIWKKRKTVLKWCIYGAVIGLIIGFSIPAEYTTVVKMAPEEKNNSKGNLSGLAAMAGVNMGSSTEGIVLDIYPDIVSSTPFLIELSQIQVKRKKAETSETLFDYMDNLSGPWWGYIIRAPFQLLGATMSIFKVQEEADENSLNPWNLTRKQRKILNNIQQRVNVSVDSKTNIITASSRMQDAEVSAMVADSATVKLVKYMEVYRTEKAKIDRDFSEEMFLDARESYHKAQKNYASYMDATQNVAREYVRAEQERLRNEQLLAYTIYSQLAQQLEMAKMKVQEQTPIVTVIEPASVPSMKSNTSKLVILIGFTFLAGIAVVVKILFQNHFLAKKEESLEEEEIANIEASLN